MAKQSKTDIKTDILFLLAGGEAHSLGDFNRALRSKWTQSAILRELDGLIKSGVIVQATRVDYLRGGQSRLTVKTYNVVRRE